MTRGSWMLLMGAAVSTMAHGAPWGTVSGRLRRLVQQEEQIGTKQALPGLPQAGGGPLIQDDHGRLLAYVRLGDHAAGTAQQLASLLAAQGLEVVHVSERYKVVTVRGYPRELVASGSLAGVGYVEEALAPMTGAWARSSPAMLGKSTVQFPPVCNAIVSEGDKILHADQARARFGVDGAGVAVGVISTSFNATLNEHNRYDQLIKQITGKPPVPFAVSNKGRLLPLGPAALDVWHGELPGPNPLCGMGSSVQIRSDLQVGSDQANDEGRAMAQIVHDLSPSSTLSFATGMNGLYAIADAIRDLFAHGSGILTDDLYSYGEPMFQDGPVAVAISEVVAKGALYTTLAGNHNDMINGQNVGAYETPAYRPTSCAGLLPDAGATCHNFDPQGDDPGYGITIGPHGSVAIGLQWAEPWYGVQDDFDLTADWVTADGQHRPIEGGTPDHDNIKSQEPWEFLTISNPIDAPVTIEAVVSRRVGQGTPRMRLFLGETPDGLSSNVTGLEYASPKAPDMESSTIPGYSGSAAAITVAASPFNNPGSVEPFSSRGTVTYYFGPVVDNHPAAPLATPEVLAKPDITATDGGANSFFGGEKDGAFRFYGTSAAAPHAAAVLALMKQKMPKLTQAQALAILRATAHPIGEGGGPV